MPNSNTPRRSALGLVVLWQLYMEPMHVYRMQKLFEAQGKDRVVNLRSRASLYQTLERLSRLGLVEVAETIPQDDYPDRVIYAITEAGRDVAREWLREMLSNTEGEYPEFITAVSMVMGLEPQDARAQLELRAKRLAAQLAEAEQQLRDAPDGLPRLFLLEEEYRTALLRAELGWLRDVVEDLRSGRLEWSEEWLRQVANQFLPPKPDSNEEADR